ncbi:MAG: hypothetical protein MHMPM18_000109 [Marteilia pararefringens]
MSNRTVDYDASYLSMLRKKVEFADRQKKSKIKYYDHRNRLHKCIEHNQIVEMPQKGPEIASETRGKVKESEIYSNVKEDDVIVNRENDEPETKVKMHSIKNKKEIIEDIERAAANLNIQARKNQYSILIRNINKKKIERSKELKERAKSSGDIGLKTLTKFEKVILLICNLIT